MENLNPRFHKGLGFGLSSTKRKSFSARGKEVIGAFRAIVVKFGGLKSGWNGPKGVLAAGAGRGRRPKVTPNHDGVSTGPLCHGLLTNPCLRKSFPGHGLVSNPWHAGSGSKGSVARAGRYRQPTSWSAVTFSRSPKQMRMALAATYARRTGRRFLSAFA